MKHSYSFQRKNVFAAVRRQVHRSQKKVIPDFKSGKLKFQRSSKHQ
jgi:hypothetical protein